MKHYLLEFSRSYRPDSLRLNKFYRDIQRVFDFSKTVNAMTDGRKHPTVPIAVIFNALFLGVLLRWGSKRRITKARKQPHVGKLLHASRSGCDNTVGQGLEQLGRDAFAAAFTRAPKQLTRHHAFRDTIGGFSLVALAGTETCRSMSRRCNDCLRYQVNTKDGTQTDDVHRVVVAQQVGTPLKPVLAVEKILPTDTPKKEDKAPGHAGEVTAGKRLVLKVINLYGPRFVEVFTTDAWYMNQPFVIPLVQQGNDLIAWVKEERTVLDQEILALATWVKPIGGSDNDGMRRYQIDDISDLDKARGFEIARRGFWVIEPTRHLFVANSIDYVFNKSCSKQANNRDGRTLSLRHDTEKMASIS